MAKFLGQCRSGLGRARAVVRQYPIRVVAVVLLLAVAVGGTVAVVKLRRIDPLVWRLLSAEERQDRADLRAIGMALQQYHDLEGFYPPASFTPELGLPDFAAMRGYLAPGLVGRLAGKAKPRLCYLGYVVVDDVLARELFALVRKPGNAVDLNRDIALDPGRNYSPYSQGGHLLRLAKGMGADFAPDIGNPAMNRGAELVPIIWEIPTAERPGGYVLYMDGHIEWVRYPGLFPMSEAMVDMMSRPLQASVESDLAPPRSPVGEIGWQFIRVGISDFLPRDLRYGARIVHCDATPTVKAGGASGYRIVTGWNDIRKLPLVDVAVRTCLLSEELALFPVEGSVPDRGEIHWKSATEARDCTYLGDGLGYRWFTNGISYSMDIARTKWRLKGGDDRVGYLLALAERFEKVPYYRNRVLVRLAAGGAPEKAAELLEKDLAATERKRDRDDAIQALGAIPGEAATKLLLSLLRSENTDDAAAARVALACPPYRSEAKEVYLDLLQHPEAWPEAFDAIAQFRWPDALPVVRAVCEAPRTVEVYCHAYVALRALEGRPVSQKVVDAAAVIKELDVYQKQRDGVDFSDAEIASARNTVLYDADQDAVVPYLLDMIVRFSSDMYVAHSGRLLVDRRSYGDNSTARDLFEKLPRDTTAAVVGRMKSVVTDPVQAAYLARLSAVVSSASPNAAFLFDDQLREIASGAMTKPM